MDSLIYKSVCNVFLNRLEKKDNQALLCYTIGFIYKVFNPYYKIVAHGHTLVSDIFTAFAYLLHFQYPKAISDTKKIAFSLKKAKAISGKRFKFAFKSESEKAIFNRFVYIIKNLNTSYLVLIKI